MTIAAGTYLGPYEILSPLGAGGMGEVYRARDTRLGRDVAIKVLPEAFARDADRLARFEREARAAAALNHPNILSIYDFGKEGDTAYTVTELLEGETLRERLSSGALPLRKAVEYAAQTAKGLAAAHDKGIIHRDIKPENLFVTKDGHVKILDFGLAGLATLPDSTNTKSPTVTRQTEPGTLMGTLGYMSPEQARGKPADQRSDIFSLGAALYEMLSGQRAFQGDSQADVLSAILKEDPPELKVSGKPAPPALDHIVRVCLEKRSEDRFSSAHDLALALQGLSGTEAEPPASKVAQAPSEGWRKKYRGAIAGSVTLFVFVTIALAFDVGGFRSKLFAPRPAPQITPSIAVLPFTNLSGDQEQEYFSDGLSEELMGLLTKVKNLHVAGRTSSFAFKGKNASLSDIGRELHVATVLEGSVRRSGDRLRVSVQLVNVSDGYQMWAETYDRTMTEVFTMQDEIASAVVAALQLTLLPQDRAAGSQHGTFIPEAHTQYLLGRHYYNLSTFDSWRRATEAYERAIRLDPNYAAAYAGLASAQFMLAGYSKEPAETEKWIQQARSSADKAIALDPALADGYSARGDLRQNSIPPDWAGARADFEKAIALDPGNVSALVSLSLHLAETGQFQEAIAEAKKATELDPLSGAAWSNLGFLLSASGDQPGALSASIRARDLYPEDVINRSQLGGILLCQGDPKGALLEYRESLEMFQLMGSAMAEHDLGHPKESQKALDELIAKYSGNWACQIAEVYAWRGEKDEAFKWLDRAYAQRDIGLTYLKCFKPFDKLRSDPRYEALLCKMKYPGACEGKP